MLIKKLVRLIKGQYLGLMFMVFAVGIFIELIFFVPVLWFSDKLFGSNPLRFQQVHHFLFTLWLWLLKMGGLLKSLPCKGEPMQGKCVIVANHPGLFDVLVLIRDIPRMSVMVKRSLSSSLGLGPVFRLSGYILGPDITNITTSLHSMKQAIKQLEMGYKFLLFPEGTGSPKGGILPFKAGAFIIARMANVPAQPVIIRNNPPFMPHEDHWYYPPYEISSIEIEFLEPITPPLRGEERKTAAELEKRFREALYISESLTKSNDCGESNL